MNISFIGLGKSGIVAERSSKTFSSISVPSIFIHDQYSPEVTKKVIKRQKLVVKNNNIVIFCGGVEEGAARE